MQTDNRLLDDLARVANGAMGALAGAREEIETLVRQRMERLLSDMDLVTREEFEAVKDVAATARLEQETLAKKVEALEAELAALKKPAPKARRTRKATTRASKTAEAK